jgi:hypothetical protein
MANETMTLISTVTVGAGGTLYINFNSIPQTYTDLMITYSGRSTNSNTLATLGLKFNGSSTGYSGKRLLGNGSATSSANLATSGIDLGLTPAANSTANSFSNIVAYIPNYTASTNKSVSSDSVEEENTTTAFQVLYASLWSNSAAVTSIELGIDANHAQYSTASLYGILKGSGGATVS